MINPDFEYPTAEGTHNFNKSAARLKDFKFEMFTDDCRNDFKTMLEDL